MQHKVHFQKDDSLEVHNFRSRKILGEPVVPTLAKKLVTWGIVKNYNVAKNILFVTTIVLFITTIFISFFLTPRTPQVNKSLGPNNSSDM